MGRSRGLIFSPETIFAAASVAFLLCVYSLSGAHDDPSPLNSAAYRTGLPVEDEAISVFLGNGQESFWVCPRCGADGNLGWLPRCRSCAYSRYNPRAFLLRPVETTAVTNGYSSSHRALDFGARSGSSVYAAEDGLVVETLSDPWAGTIVRIRHEGGLQTLYGHLAEALVKPGSFVRTGEVIALSGSTGASTGPHLHFEVCFDGVQVDPLDFLAPW